MARKKRKPSTRLEKVIHRTGRNVASVEGVRRLVLSPQEEAIAKKIGKEVKKEGGYFNRQILPLTEAREVVGKINDELQRIAKEEELVV